MKRLLISLFLFLIFGSACQPRLMWWRQEPDSYQAIVRKWTRTGELYQGLNTILVISATYPHPDIRCAHVRQFALDHHLSEPEEKECLLAEEAKAKEQLEFIVTSMSDEEEWWALNEESSIWTINLVNEKGVRTKPEKIELFKEVPIYFKTYYSVVSPWKKVYRITFPANVNDVPFLDEQTPHFKMEFLSAVGQITLQWDLKKKAPRTSN